MDAEDVVNQFIEAVGRKDEASAMALVADDCYYDNVPVGDMTGKDKMAEFLAPALSLAGNISADKLLERKSLLKQLDQTARLIESSSAYTSMQDKAFSLLTAPNTHTRLICPASLRRLATAMARPLTE